VADILVRYFAAAEEAAGRPEERIALADATVGSLRTELVARHGEAMEKVLRSGSFLVGGVVSRDPSREVDGTVDVLPPFAGG
jgi:molybdopterin converting factor small subunit